jgi:hypothetical protein
LIEGANLHHYGVVRVWRLLLSTFTFDCGGREYSPRANSAPQHPVLCVTNSFMLGHPLMARYRQSSQFHASLHSRCKKQIVTSITFVAFLRNRRIDTLVMLIGAITGECRFGFELCF